MIALRRYTYIILLYTFDYDCFFDFQLRFSLSIKYVHLPRNLGTLPIEKN